MSAGEGDLIQSALWPIATCTEFSLPDNISYPDFSLSLTPPPSSLKPSTDRPWRSLSRPYAALCRLPTPPGRLTLLFGLATAKGWQSRLPTAKSCMMGGAISEVCWHPSWYWYRPHISLSCTTSVSSSRYSACLSLGKLGSVVLK